MEEIAPVVFPVNTARPISALLVLLARLEPLPGKLLARLDLPARKLLLWLDLLPRLALLPALLPALPPTLDSLPGLLVGLVMVIQTSVLLEEFTVRSISTGFFRLCHVR